jgi:hypothetical protein
LLLQRAGWTERDAKTSHITEAELEMFYKHHNPAMIPKVPSLLANAPTEEIVTGLEAKYGASVSDPAARKPARPSKSAQADETDLLLRQAGWTDNDAKSFKISKPELEAFYRLHNPEMIAKVPVLLESADTETIVSGLEAKYGTSLSDPVFRKHQGSQSDGLAPARPAWPAGGDGLVPAGGRGDGLAPTGGRGDGLAPAGGRDGFSHDGFASRPSWSGRGDGLAPAGGRGDGLAVVHAPIVQRINHATAPKSANERAKEALLHSAGWNDADASKVRLTETELDSFYQKHNPNMIPKVPGLLAGHDTKSIVSGLEAKYGMSIADPVNQQTTVKVKAADPHTPYGQAEKCGCVVLDGNVPCAGKYAIAHKDNNGFAVLFRQAPYGGYQLIFHVHQRRWIAESLIERQPCLIANSVADTPTKVTAWLLGSDVSRKAKVSFFCKSSCGENMKDIAALMHTTAPTMVPTKFFTPQPTPLPTSVPSSPPTKGTLAPSASPTNTYPPTWNPNLFIDKTYTKLMLTDFYTKHSPGAFGNELRELVEKQLTQYNTDELYSAMMRKYGQAPNPTKKSKGCKCMVVTKSSMCNGRFIDSELEINKYQMYTSSGSSGQNILYYDSSLKQWAIGKSMKKTETKCAVSTNTGFARNNFPQDSTWSSSFGIRCCPKSSRSPTSKPTNSPTAGPTTTKMPTPSPSAKPTTIAQAQKRVIFYPPNMPKNSKGGLVSACLHISIKGVPPFEKPKCAGIYTMNGVAGHHPMYAMNGYTIVYNNGWVVQTPNNAGNICLAAKDKKAAAESPHQVLHWLTPSGNSAVVAITCSKQTVNWFKPTVWPGSSHNLSPPQLRSAPRPTPMIRAPSGGCRCIVLEDTKSACSGKYIADGMHEGLRKYTRVHPDESYVLMFNGRVWAFIKKGPHPAVCLSSSSSAQSPDSAKLWFPHATAKVFCDKWCDETLPPSPASVPVVPQPSSIFTVDAAIPPPAAPISSVRATPLAGTLLDSGGLFQPPAPSPPVPSAGAISDSGGLFQPPAPSPPVPSSAQISRSPAVVTKSNRNIAAAFASHTPSSQSFTQKLFRQELVVFYKAHGPSKVKKIDYFLTQYTPTEIRTGIIAKYGMSLRALYPGLDQACECVVIEGNGIPCVGMYHFDKLTGNAYPSYGSPDTTYRLYNKGGNWLVTRAMGMSSTESTCMSAGMTKTLHSSRLPQQSSDWKSTGTDVKVACQKCAVHSIGGQPSAGLVKSAVTVLETRAPTMQPTSTPTEAPYCPCLALDIQGRGEDSDCHGSFKYTGQQLGGHPVYMRVRPKQDYVLYFVEAEGRWVISEKVGADSFCIVAAMLASLPDRVTKWMNDLGEIVGASMYCDLKCAAVSFEREPPRFRLPDALAGGG